MPAFRTLFSVPLGLRYMLLSALGFAAMSVCVKLSFEHGIPILEIVAARALVSLVLSYADLRRKRLPILGTHRLLLFARGAVGSIALIAVYSALTLLPLAEATMLQYTHPIFVSLLALVFLSERIHRGVVVGVLCCFVGVVFVVQPALIFSALNQAPVELSTLGVGIALLGAFGSAIAYVLVRKLSQLEDSSVIILYFPLVALPMSLLCLGDGFVWPQSWEVWCLLVMVGVFTQIGQIGLTKAMQFEAAGRATAFSYVQVVFAVAFGFIFFDEVPNILAYLGLVFIMSGALINIVLKPRA